MGHGFSCSAAHGILLDQGWNPVPCISRWIPLCCNTRDVRKLISHSAVLSGGEDDLVCCVSSRDLQGDRHGEEALPHPHSRAPRGAETCELSAGRSRVHPTMCSQEPGMCSPGACWPCPWQSVDLKLGRGSQSRFLFGKLTLFHRNGQGQVTCPHGLKVWGVSPHHLGQEPQVEPSSQAWVWEKKHRGGDPRVTLPEDSLQRLLWEGHGRSHWPRASMWPQTKRQNL